MHLRNKQLERGLTEFGRDKEWQSLGGKCAILASSHSEPALQMQDLLHTLRSPAGLGSLALLVGLQDLVQTRVPTFGNAAGNVSQFVGIGLQVVIAGFASSYST
jgi:hypothetical protein